MPNLFPISRPEVNQSLLVKRYTQGDEKTWDDVVKRVAGHAGEKTGRVQEFFDAIKVGKFFPSRMAYMGTAHPFASSCFVFPVGDSLDSIMQALNDACQVQKYGGGTGYNFSHLRPQGNLISTSGGEASGPVSFMGLFHNAMEVVHRAGKNMQLKWEFSIVITQTSLSLSSVKIKRVLSGHLIFQLQLLTSL